MLMHREVLPGVDEVDHINGNKLDNQRENLRAVTRAQNLMNQKKMPGHLSKFKGVSLARRTNKWRAYISLSGQFTALGIYPTEEEAAHAYDAAAEKYFGAYAKTNAMLGLL